MKILSIPFAWFAVLFVCLLASCGQNPAPPPPASVPPPSSPKPETFYYVLAFDKVNLREAPNQKAQVLAQLAEGEFVESTGEVSHNREEIILRDIPYDEPYFKVNTLGADKKQGWMFSAALKPFYAGPKSTAPELEKLALLANFLKKLDPQKIESGKQAIDFVKNNYASSSGTQADAVFIFLQSFLFRMEMEGNFYSLTERQQWADEDFEAVWKEKFDMNKYPLTKTLASNGFRLEEGEGMIFPIMDLARLTEFFRDKVTPPMKEYLLQLTQEQKDNAISDGGLVIGLDTIIDRAIFWENFNKQNPYFVRSLETRESEKWLQNVLLTGADNTPAFDYETNMAIEEFKKAWASIQEKHAGTKLAQKVKELTALLASEGGKRTEKVEEWLIHLHEPDHH
jgi:hypothetical protein